jgi:hypothetical protein
VASDYQAVLLAGDEWLQEAVLLNVPRQDFKLRFADLARVRRIRAQVVDRDFDDGEGEAVGVTLFRFFRFFRKARLAQQEQLSRR